MGRVSNLWVATADVPKAFGLRGQSFLADSASGNPFGLMMAMSSSESRQAVSVWKAASFIEPVSRIVRVDIVCRVNVDQNRQSWPGKGFKLLLLLAGASGSTSPSREGRRPWVLPPVRNARHNSTPANAPWGAAPQCRGVRDARVARGFLVGCGPLSTCFADFFSGLRFEECDWGASVAQILVQFFYEPCGARLKSQVWTRGDLAGSVPRALSPNFKAKLLDKQLEEVGLRSCDVVSSFRVQVAWGLRLQGWWVHGLGLLYWDVHGASQRSRHRLCRGQGPPGPWKLLRLQCLRVSLLPVSLNPK